MKNTIRSAKENLILGGKGFSFLVQSCSLQADPNYVHNEWYSFFYGWFRCHGIRPYCHEEAGIYSSDDWLVTSKNTLAKRTGLQVEKQDTGFPFFGFSHSCLEKIRPKIRD